MWRPWGAIGAREKGVISLSVTRFHIRHPQGHIPTRSYLPHTLISFPISRRTDNNPADNPEKKEKISAAIAGWTGLDKGNNLDV